MHISFRSFINAHLDNLSIIDVMHCVDIVYLLEVEIILVKVITIEISFIVPFTYPLRSVPSVIIQLVTFLLKFILIR